MRRITLTTILLALFAATTASAQHYDFAQPILPTTGFGGCSNCGPAWNSRYCGKSFFSPCVTVNGCPYDTASPCERTIVGEMMCDMRCWWLGHCGSCGCGECGEGCESGYCNESSGEGCWDGYAGSCDAPSCDGDGPAGLPPNPPCDEDVNPFQDDPASVREYRISDRTTEVITPLPERTRTVAIGSAVRPTSHTEVDTSSPVGGQPQELVPSAAAQRLCRKSVTRQLPTQQQPEAQQELPLEVDSEIPQVIQPEVQPVDHIAPAATDDSRFFRSITTSSSSDQATSDRDTVTDYSIRFRE